MESNENIELIMGNPKKAINKLAYPTILSMLLMFLNNIIDSMWVGGLGSEALAALGFISPLYLVIIGLGNGIGAGANSSMSRFIGANKLSESNNAAIHSIFLTLILSVVICIIGVLFLKDLLILFRAGNVLFYAMDYGSIIFLTNLIFLLSSVLASIFRAEGDAKKATLPLVFNAILNMILDPILIYYFGWGMKGAAIATIISTFIALIIMLYWIFVKKDTFFKLKLDNYKRNLSIYKEILIVSLPASLEEIIFSIVAICFNYLIMITAGSTEVAVFTVVWRFISLAFIPSISVGIVTVTVSGIAYGAKNYKNFDMTIKYSTLLSFVITIVICVIFFIFAYPISEYFNFLSHNSQMISRTAEVLRLMLFYNIFIPFSVTATYVYQGVGSGFKSLFLTILRELVLSVSFAYILAIPFSMGIFGVYLGAIIGMAIGCIFGFICIILYRNKFKKECDLNS